MRNLELILMAVGAGLSFVSLVLRLVVLRRVTRPWRTFVARPRAKLATAPDGTVAMFVGTVVPEGELLTSPLEARGGVFFSSGAFGRRAVAKRQRGGSEFLLDDGTAIARVKATGAAYVSSPKQHGMKAIKWSRDGRTVVAPRGLGAFLEGTRWDAGKIHRYREDVIASRDRIAVVGMLATEAEPGGAPDAAPRSGSSPRRTLEAPPGHELVLSDDPVAIMSGGAGNGLVEAAARPGLSAETIAHSTTPHSPPSTAPPTEPWGASWGS